MRYSFLNESNSSTPADIIQKELASSFIEGVILKIFESFFNIKLGACRS
jgi:hypothetical protein